MDIAQAKNAIRYAFKIGRTANLIGLHGIGKSSIIYELAKEDGYEVIEIRLGQMADAGDLIGLQEFIKDPTTGHAFATRHILPDWFPRSEKKTILFLDELNRAPKDIQQAIFELVYDHRLKGVSIGPNSHVVAACNPATEDYQVLSFDDSAFQDRFVHMILKPTEMEFIQYARGKKLESSVVDFLTNYTKMLDQGDLKGFDLAFVKPSRRSWEALANLRTVVPKSDNDLFLEMAMGIVGREAALAYKSYADTHVSVITAEEVLADYKTVASKHLDANKNNRTDIIANVIEGLDAEFKLRTEAKKGMTLSEANNLIDFMKNTNPEQKYTLAMTLRNNYDCVRNVEGMGNEGLLNSVEVEEMLLAMKNARKNAKKASEKTAANKEK